MTSLAVANSALFFIFVLFVVVRKITFEGRKKNEKIIPGRHKKSHPGATPETNFFFKAGLSCTRLTLVYIYSVSQGYGLSNCWYQRAMYG